MQMLLKALDFDLWAVQFLQAFNYKVNPDNLEKVRISYNWNLKALVAKIIDIDEVCRIKPSREEKPEVQEFEAINTDIFEF